MPYSAFGSLLAIFCLAAIGTADGSPSQGHLVHTVIASGCSRYFDWQVMTFAYR